MGTPGPHERAVTERWAALRADATATAAAYEDDGWETLSLHPGDVTALTGAHGDRVGFDVLVPDDEYRDLRAWFDADFTVDGYEVYRTLADGVVLLLVVVRDPADRRALLYPLYYSLADEDARSLLATAAERGVVHTYLRRLSGAQVTLRHDDPGLFDPPETDGGDADATTQ
jgi:hypothetical protein